MSQVMNTHELENNLSQFTGTENYYRVMPRLVITDGVQYLANQANMYWLVSTIYSYLTTQPIRSGFVVARLTASGKTADLVLDDGNDQVICEKYIDYTGFRLVEVTIYCSYQHRYWVVALQTEHKHPIPSAR
jgi:hypothetical protein